MKIGYGGGKTGFGPGVDICLTGDEVAEAIDLWLAMTGRLIVSGPRTVTVNGHKCKYGLVYVDPSGSVKSEDGELCLKGSGEKPVTRKYEREYGLYLAYLRSLHVHVTPLCYESWLEDWEGTNMIRRQAILKEYADRLGQSSLQERDVVSSALCFDLYVSPRT